MFSTNGVTKITLEDIINSFGDVVAVGNADMQVLACNEMFARQYGRTIEDTIGKNMLELYPAFKHSVFYEALEYTLATGEPTTRIGYSSPYARCVTVRAKMLGDLFLFSSSSLQNVFDKGYEETNVDKLTSLADRLAFEQDMERLLVGDSIEPFGLMLLDIKKFKSFNESLGYLFGDMLLMETSARLKHVMKTSKVYRLNGDHFAAIMRVPEKEADDLIKQVSDAFKLPYKIDSEGYNIQVSIGHSWYGGATKSMSQKSLLSDLEFALTKAKKSRTHVEKFRTANRSCDKTVLIKDLHNALKKTTELVLHYQPQIDLLSGKVCGAEALIRWQHPIKGTVSPGEFIPVAEEFGIIEQLDRYVLVMSIQEIRKFRQLGINIPISINFSAPTLSNPDTVRFVASVLERTAINPKLLTIEITETVEIEDTEISQEVVHGLKKLGLGIALDDFGTGYSSLGYLNRYPTDYIKIDKEFITGIHKDAKLKVLVTNTIKMAHSLGMHIVAEGVEEKAEHDILLAGECDIIQGYYFSKPLPAEPFVQYIRKQQMSKLESTIM